jgi:hypothetical protein
MSRLFTRALMVAALAGFAAPAFPCEAMKQTTASADKKVEKEKKDAKAESAKKGEKPAPVASAEQTKR